MMTFEELCEIVCENCDLDCNNENYTVKFIYADEFSYGYALIEYHIINRSSNRDFGPTFVIISDSREVIKCPCEWGKSDSVYRNEAYDILEELRDDKIAKENYWAEIQQQMHDDYVRECNKEFNNMMNDFDAWGNID